MNLIGCLNVTSELATINRYSKSRLNNPESVLEHTGFVSMISYFIGSAINNSNSYKKVDIGVLLSKSIVHDIEEFITGDVQRPTKHSSPQMLSLFEELSDESIIKVSLETDVSRVIKDWRESKKGYEGSIVSFCDTFSVLYKSYDEIVLRGNKTIQFGSVDILLNSIEKRVNDLAFHGVDSSITSGLYDSCKTILSKVSESLK